jgi:asparagine synthase (glutamine-hydrolysing)
MSVIAGLVRFDGAPVHADELAQAANRLSAPGVGEPAYWAGGGAAMLARQHTVTHEDMAERQPWVGGGGKLVLVYDGRLDNREEIAAALGIRLSGEVVPDGLLLLEALLRWGEAALPRLIGDFALALWDARNRKLLLARDQLGRRTLCYHHGDGFIAFASTYPALLALPGVPRELDELGIADFLVHNTGHPVETIYRGVRRTPAATGLTFSAGGMRRHRYWSPRPQRELHLASDEEYIEAAREYLERAVACRLRAKDGIASTLSGGLDSSAVASTAARLLAPGRLLTVTSVPPEGVALPPFTNAAWYPDERPYVRAIAAMYPNMDTVLASSDAPHWIETAPGALFAVSGLPARNVSNLGWLLPCRDSLKEAGISALLTGEAGNATWSYDGLRGLVDMFRQGRWLRLARELYLTGRARPYGQDALTLLRREIFRPLEPVALGRWRKRRKGGGGELWSSFSAIHPEFAHDIGLVARCREAGHSMGYSGMAGGLEDRLYLLGKLEHGRDMATALRALTGIETRAPLLDPRLLEFCLSLPERQFLRDGSFRRLPRLAMEGRLPAAVLQNNLIGSQNPEMLLRLGAMRAALPDEIAALKQSPLAARIVDLERLERIVRDWPNNNETRFALPRALHVARFLRWAEKGL